MDNRNDHRWFEQKCDVNVVDSIKLKNRWLSVKSDR